MTKKFLKRKVETRFDSTWPRLRRWLSFRLTWKGCCGSGDYPTDRHLTFFFCSWCGRLDEMEPRESFSCTSVHFSAHVREVELHSNHWSTVMLTSRPWKNFNELFKENSHQPTSGNFHLSLDKVYSGGHSARTFLTRGYFKLNTATKTSSRLHSHFVAGNCGVFWW